MRIRFAVSADLDAIVAIYNAAVPEGVTADVAPVSVEERREWFKLHTPDRRPMWVAEGDDGTVIGWVSLQDFYGRPVYHATAEISVYVAQAHRNRGVARRLLEEAILGCPNLGVRNLIGLVYTHNEPSVRLFAEMGFQRWGTMPRVTELAGSERDVAILGLRVESG